jgi:hypothetical protein
MDRTQMAGSSGSLGNFFFFFFFFFLSSNLLIGWPLSI